MLVVILDQASKYTATKELILHKAVPLISGFNFTLAYNSGAAFSFLSNADGWQRWFFISISSAISIAIIIWLFRLSGQRRCLAVGLVLILGGALGNLWDRITLGYVIDFLDVYYQKWHWPAFNVADSAITVGAVLLIVDAIWFDRAEVSTHAGNS